MQRSLHKSEDTEDPTEAVLYILVNADTAPDSFDCVPMLQVILVFYVALVVLMLLLNYAGQRVENK